jgi:hypothetical protein
MLTNYNVFHANVAQKIIKIMRRNEINFVISRRFPYHSNPKFRFL